MISEAQCVDSALRKKYSTKWQHSAVSTGQPQRRHPPCHLTLVKRCRVTGRASQSTRSRPWCSTLVYRWVTLHGTAPVLAQAWQRRACGMLCDWLNHGLLTAHANANHVGRPGHLGAMKVPGTAELFFCVDDDNSLLLMASQAFCLVILILWSFSMVPNPSPFPPNAVVGTTT